MNVNILIGRNMEYLSQHMREYYLHHRYVRLQSLLLLEVNLNFLKAVTLSVHKSEEVNTSGEKDGSSQNPHNGDGVNSSGEKMVAVLVFHYH